MKKVLIITSIILVLVILYSRFIATSGLKIHEYKVVNSDITEQYNGLKIVHISDIHYGSTVNNKKFEKIIEQINFIKPDIVVLTGDLIDEKFEYNFEELVNNLSNINAKLGKYAISGNHDYSVEDYNDLISDGGFINLDNTYELIYNNSMNPVIISGISSNIKDTTDLAIKTSKFDEYISSSEKPVYSILLMHEPDSVDNLNIDNYDLILSGHSHNGQINIPLLKNLYLPKLSRKYYNGHYLINNTNLYVSNGLGTSGLRFRLFSKPSFNLYRITNK